MIQAHEFVAEARRMLQAARSSEVRRRGAASRAYYGCYHLFLKYAEARGYRFSRSDRKGMHTHLLSALPDYLSDDDDIDQTYHAFCKLKDLRIACDYGLAHDIDYDQVADAVERAEHIVALLTEE